MVNKDGVPTNAVYGFANRLESLLKQNPEYIVVALMQKGRLLEVSYWKNIKGQESQHRMNLFVSFQ